LNILIYGNARSGKTLLANKLADQYRKRGFDVLVIDDDFAPREQEPVTTDIIKVLEKSRSSEVDTP